MIYVYILFALVSGDPIIHHSEKVFETKGQCEKAVKAKAASLNYDAYAWECSARRDWP